MHGNTPYAGLPGISPAGRPGGDGYPDLSIDQKRRLRQDLTQVEDRVRLYLPDEFVIGSELTYGTNGLEALIAVQPPIGDAVSAGFTPPVSIEDEGEEYIDEVTRDELARGLAASAVFQVRLAIDNDLTPTAQ